MKKQLEYILKNDKYYDVYKIVIEVELSKKDRRKTTIDFKDIDGYKQLSISGSILRTTKKGSRYSDVSFGQINDTIRVLIENGYTSKKQEELNRLLDIWDRWHLNDLNAGTRKQREFLKKEGLYNANTYDLACEFLKEKRLYIDNGYVYGSGWLVEELPEDIEKELEQMEGE